MIRTDVRYKHKEKGNDMRKTTKKAAVAAFIAVCLTAGMTLPVPFGGEIGTVVYADGETTPEAATEYVVSTAEELQAAVVAHKTGTIKLSDNIVLSTCLTIDNATGLTLDLQNHTLSRDLESAVDSGMVIDITGNSNVTIKSGVITGGYNKANGGGIQATGDLTLDGVNIVDNMASAAGGGVYVFDGNLTVANSVIQNNTAAGSFGGGIYVARVNKPQSADICNLKFTGGNVIERNEVHGDGGGVYFYGNSFDTSESTKLEVKNNTAYNTGGGLYINTFSTTDMTFDGIYSITGNKVVHPAGTYGPGGGAGGGLYTGGSVNVTIAGAVIKGNTAAIDGGGVYSGRTLTLSSGTIGGTGEGEGNTAGGNGGGIYAPNLTIDGGSVSGNTAAGNGGGIYSSSVFTMNAGDITDNTAANGGGIYCPVIDRDVNSTLAGGTISNNTATVNGGGIYSKSAVEISGTGSEISANTAAGNGGGVYSEAYSELDTAKQFGAVILAGGKITGNSAANGGGIYSYNGNIVATNSGTTDISGNTVTGNGGGIYVGSAYGEFSTSGKGMFINNIAQTILGNEKSDGSASNVYLVAGRKIYNTLRYPDNTVRYGIDMEKPGIFTEGYAFSQKQAYIPFSSENPKYSVYVYEADNNGGNMKVGELALMPASDPVESGIKKVKFVWKQDGTCDFYTSKDGQNYGEPAPANVEGSTATMTVEGKTYTSVKPGSAPSVVTDADVKVTYDNDNGSYTMTLSIVCGVPKNGDDCLVGVGFYVKDLSGTDTHVLKKTGFASWSAKYSVKFGVSGQGVVVKPFALVKPADKFNDDSVEPNEELIDTWGTFYPAS